MKQLCDKMFSVVSGFDLGRKPPWQPAGPSWSAVSFLGHAAVLTVQRQAELAFMGSQVSVHKIQDLLALLFSGASYFGGSDWF